MSIIECKIETNTSKEGLSFRLCNSVVYSLIVTSVKYMTLQKKNWKEKKKKKKNQEMGREGSLRMENHRIPGRR